MVAIVRATRNGLAEVGLRPILLSSEGDPVPIPAASAEFADYLNHLQKVTEEVGLTTQYGAAGAEVWLKGIGETR
jgi:hypothetical protein